MDHPHGRGEHTVGEGRRWSVGGSPPRAWGARRSRPRRHASRRITPTGVGSTLPDLGVHVVVISLRPSPRGSDMLDEDSPEHVPARLAHVSRNASRYTCHAEIRSLVDMPSRAFDGIAGPPHAVFDRLQGHVDTRHRPTRTSGHVSGHWGCPGGWCPACGPASVPVFLASWDETYRMDRVPVTRMFGVRCPSLLVTAADPGGAPVARSARLVRSAG